jgi:hypothetical protein
MAAEETKETAVATAEESTTPTGGVHAIPQVAPSVGGVPGPTEAGGSGTLSDLLKTGDGPGQEPPKLALFSLAKNKRTSTALDDAAVPEPKRGRTAGAPCTGLTWSRRQRGTFRRQTDPQPSLRHPHLCEGG